MFGGRAPFFLSFPEVSSALALIESESVKGGSGVGDSEPFFPGELGGGPSASFVVSIDPSIDCLYCFLYSGGGKVGSAAKSMTFPTLPQLLAQPAPLIPLRRDTYAPHKGRGSLPPLRSSLA